MRLFLWMMVVSGGWYGCAARAQVVQGKAGTRELVLHERLQKRLDLPEGLLTEARGFVHLGDRFSFADPWTNRACFVFGTDGTSPMQVGRTGQGPGEYQLPVGLAVTDERLFVMGAGDQRLVMYDREGTYLSHTRNPLQGVPSAMAPLGDGFVAGVFSRYATHVVHVFDRDGAPLRAFCPTPDDIAPFDTFAPAGGLVVLPDRIGVYTNYAYAVQWFDPGGNKQGETHLAGPLFVPPDTARAAGVKGIKNELAYRASFTQLTGVFATKHGYVTCLVGWDDVRTARTTLEFWDADFQGYGRYTVPAERAFLGAGDGDLLFVDVDEAALVVQDVPQP